MLKVGDEVRIDPVKWREAEKGGWDYTEIFKITDVNEYKNETRIQFFSLFSNIRYSRYIHEEPATAFVLAKTKPKQLNRTKFNKLLEDL